MATKSSRHQAQGQNSAGPVPIVVGGVLFFILMAIFWSRYHTELATAYAWIRIIEFGPFVMLNTWASAGVGLGLLIFGAVTLYRHGRTGKYGLMSAIAGALILMAYCVGGIFESWFVFFLHSNKSLIEFDHLLDSGLAANILLLLVVVVPFSIWMARKSQLTNPMNEWNFARKKDYDLDSFTDRLGFFHRHLQVFRKLDLSTKSIDTGKFRMAETEKQVAIKYKLLDKGKPGEFVLNQDRAAAYFRGTLGKPWKTFTDLTQSELAVIAALLPRIAATDLEMSDDDFKEALETSSSLLDGYWVDAASTLDENTAKMKLNLEAAVASVKKYGKHKIVRKYLKKHAYVYTMIYGMLIESRRLGVLEPAQFRWLRVVNRRLWLVVNNAGRGGAFAEVGGVVSHYKTELRRTKGVERPQINAAIKGLREAVDGFKFSEEELAELAKQFPTKEDPATIDPAKAGGQRPTLYVAAIWNVDGGKKELFEVAIVGAAASAPLLAQRCKIQPSAELISECELTGADLETLPKAPTVEATLTKILEICNGHDVVTFDAAGIEGIKGLERSAKAVAYAKPDGVPTLASALAAEEILIDEKTPELKSALQQAIACRALHVAQQKAALQAKLEEAKK
jgi:intracellular multiplication protein IcmP